MTAQTCNPYPTLREARQRHHVTYSLIRKNHYRATDAESPELPSFIGFSCPHGPWQAWKDRQDGQTGKGYRVPCRTRSCPSCGPIWTKRYQVWFRWKISQVRETFILVGVPKERWRLIRDRVKRAKGHCAGIEVKRNQLHVISTVSIKGCETIAPKDAKERLVEWVAQARRVKRPILSTRDWRLPSWDTRSEAEKEEARKQWKLIYKGWLDIRKVLEQQKIPYEEHTWPEGRGIYWKLPEGIERVRFPQARVTTRGP